MAKKAYGGVSNVAENGIKIYGGVNNIAQNIVRGYCGVDNVAQQFWGDSVQPALKPATNWIGGGTYELNTCPAIMGVIGGLHLGYKLCKPYFIRYGAQTYFTNLRNAVINYFLSVQGNANTVYLDFQSGTLNDDPVFYVTVDYATIDNLERTISGVTESTHFGNTYATITERVTMTEYFTMRLNLVSGEITRYEGTTGTSFNWIGVVIDGTLTNTVRLRITNLGMTTYSVSMIYDWYWNFGSDNPMEDKVDGLKAFAYNCSSEFDGIVVDKRGSSITLPGFLFQTGRTVEIDFGEFDRHYTEYTSPYYKYYEPCELFSIYNSNASQYSTHKSAGIILNGWNDNDPNEPYPKSHGVGLWGQVGATYEDYMGVNGLKNKKFQIVLHDTGGWRAGHYQFIYGGSAADDTTFWLNVNNLYFSIGQSRAPGNPTAAYTFKVKSVAVY